MFGKSFHYGRVDTMPPITVMLSATPNPALVGEPVSFTGTVSGGILPLVFAWDFDEDGNYDSFNAEDVYAYRMPFDGQIKLMVTDSQGCTGSGVAPITVNSPPPNSGGGGGGCFISISTQ